MPSFERPVARELVHRQSTSEVLPTDFEVRASDEFSVALQWPRRHGFFSTLPPDSAIIAETIRQVTILTCHLGYDVPLDARFLMTGLGFEQLGTSPRHASGEALELNAFVSCVDVRRTLRGELRSVQMNIELAGRDGVLAVGHGDALIVGATAYQRMRGESVSASPPTSRRVTPVAADEVGRGSADDVVVGRTGLGLEVDVDGRHPIFFDHLLDHIPGVALIEACKQALCLELGDPAAELRDYEAEFLRVVEFDIPAVISAEVTGVNANFTVYQRGVASMVASEKISSSAGAAVQAR